MLKSVLIGIILIGIISCEPKKNNDVKEVKRDTTLHNVDSIKHFFAKRYGPPRG